MAQYDADSPVVEYSLSGNPFTDALFDQEAYFRSQWSTLVGGKTSVTYSFPWADGVASKFFAGYGDEPTATTTGAVTSSEAPGIALAFQRWADVANITFTNIAETGAGQVGDIRIAFSSEVGSGLWGYAKIVSNGADNTFPADNTQGDIWISPEHKGESFAQYDYNFTAIMHEIGHALGLAHPFEGNIIPAGYDNQRYTIMSYTDPDNVYYYNQDTNTFEYLMITPMVYDIAAVQHIYGANTSFHSGNDIYSYDPARPFFATIWDAGGTDTIDVGNFAKTCRIDLRDGQYSTLGFSVTDLTDNLGIAFNAVIENANGGLGNDTLTGNALANTINGNSGNDTIQGLDGNDILSGGVGDDLLNGGVGNDTASYEGASAGVTVSLATSSRQDTLGAGKDKLGGIENLRGSAFVDKLSGDATNNRLDGGIGADVMRGAAGDDTYIIDNSRDKAVELGGAGIDTVISTVALTLRANVENLTLNGSATVGKGNALGNVIVGAGGNDTLLGYDGADTLQGNAGVDSLTGGAGRDVLTGGAGADRFIFANGDFAGGSDATCDAILDFSHSDRDRIRLSLVDANTLNGAVDDAFAYIGSAEFSHHAGELRWFANGSNHYDVQGDTNGDGIADFWIAVTSSTALAKGDFVL